MLWESFACLLLTAASEVFAYFCRLWQHHAALMSLLTIRCNVAYVQLAGLADPGPVAAALWTDDELEAAVHLDAVVTVVDAKNIQRQLEQQGSHDAANEAQKQIAYADTVLLNKVIALLQVCIFTNLQLAFPSPTPLHPAFWLYLYK